MKTLILIVLSSAVIFASTPKEVEAKVSNIADMNTSHTQRIEKRISEIEKELEEKAKERLEKAKVREEKIKQLDKTLKEKAKKREDSYDSKNNSTNEEIKKELASKQEPAKANS